MGDVFEYIVDGTSGLVLDEITGKVLIVGCCSGGTVGKAHIVTQYTDLAETLGSGPLVDRLRDMIAQGGQNPRYYAVPIEGLSGGYITPVEQTGDGPEAEVSGYYAANADVRVEILTGGALETATYRLSLDGGDTWGDETVTPANGQITAGETGTTLVLDQEDPMAAGDVYSWMVRAAIEPITHIGTGPEISASGDPLRTAEIVLLITEGGALNEATYQLSYDGEDAWELEKTLPMDGKIELDDTGVTITLPEGEYVTGDSYSFNLNPPVPTISTVLTTIEAVLEIYEVEFIYVVGPSDATDWASSGAYADVMWNKHRPTFFIHETRLPYDNEDIDDWVAALVSDRADYAHRFISVVASYAEVSDYTGQRVRRNMGGLFAGRLASVPVMRAPGRVRDGGISQASLPDDYNSGHQQELEDAGYVTAKRYYGLSSVYFGDERTLAEDTSDYLYLTVLRVVFKAVRLLRIQALKSMYDELGDPVIDDGATGLIYLQGNLEHALDTMVKAIPKELAGHVVEIPMDQDFVNNGVACMITLIGIPIIRKIKLYANYVYAGSDFDPRLADAA